MTEPKESGVDRSLNLLTLARTGRGALQSIPGTPFEVQALEERRSETTKDPIWILLLGGELIVDLPFGDFRILEPGESLHLPPGVAVTFQPTEAAVVLRWRND